MVCDAVFVAEPQVREADYEGNALSVLGIYAMKGL